MGSDGPLEAAARIIRDFSDSRFVTQRLQHLSAYHGHQTRLLVKLFSKLKKKIIPRISRAALTGSERDEFVDDMPVVNRLILKLERTLRGGSFAIWCQYAETQDDLERIQLLLVDDLWKSNGTANRPQGERQKSTNKYKERVRKARMKDRTIKDTAIKKLIRKFGSRKKSAENYLAELIPEVKNTSSGVKGYKYVVFQSFLSRFSVAPLDTLADLQSELNAYLEHQLRVMDVDVSSFGDIDFQVIRKPSGSIVALYLGNHEGPDTVQELYCPEIRGPERMPVLYTTREIRESRPQNGGFLVAERAIRERLELTPYLTQYVVWRRGRAPSRDIYLAERIFGESGFILATLLGDSGAEDQVRQIPRDESAVKTALCPENEEPWISDDGWDAYGMASLRCNSRYLDNYHHQIFIHGPRGPAAR